MPLSNAEQSFYRSRLCTVWERIDFVRDFLQLTTGGPKGHALLRCRAHPKRKDNTGAAGGCGGRSPPRNGSKLFLAAPSKPLPPGHDNAKTKRLVVNLFHCFEHRTNHQRSQFQASVASRIQKQQRCVCACLCVRLGECTVIKFRRRAGARQLPSSKARSAGSPSGRGVRTCQPQARPTSARTPSRTRG